MKDNASTETLSIIIVNYNAGRVLHDCIAAIEDSPWKGETLEVIVIDNRSTDNSMDSLLRDFPKLKLIHNTQNVGFAKAVNMGIHHASGQFLLLLNPDCIIQNGCLDTMMAFFRAVPDASIAGCKLRNADGTLQFSARSFPILMNGIFDRKSLFTKLFPQNRFSKHYLERGQDTNTYQMVDWVSGAFMMIRRDALDHVGLLDEQFFIFMEDIDLCLRMKEGGRNVYYVPMAEAMHHIGKSASQHPFWMLWELHKSIWHYYKKHFTRNILLDFLILSGICIRMVVGVIRNTIRGLFIHRLFRSSTAS